MDAENQNTVTINVAFNPSNVVYKDVKSYEKGVFITAEYCPSLGKSWTVAKLWRSNNGNVKVLECIGDCSYDFVNGYLQSKRCV